MTRISASQVKCNKCNKTYEHRKGGGTSSLRTHLVKVEGIACPAQTTWRKRAHSPESETVNLDEDDPAVSYINEC